MGEVIERVEVIAGRLTKKIELAWGVAVSGTVRDRRDYPSKVPRCFAEVRRTLEGRFGFRAPTKTPTSDPRQ